MRVYEEFLLKEIRATGWLREYLKTQAAGMTGNLDRVGEPFSGKYWDEDDQAVLKETYRFLGGLNSANDSWVPFEQTGYWIDGMVRTGHLIDDETLLEKAKPRVYNPVKYIDEEGFIGPQYLKNGTVWAHAVFFRALIAEYTATKDERILEAMKRHLLRVPLKNIYHSYRDGRIINVRNICNVEAALWVYGETGDRRFLNMAEESYKVFNRIFYEDRGVILSSKMRGVTVRGMLADSKADMNHGVTYCEVCKIAAILHMYTGKDHYKQAAVNAFDKMVRDNMIVDGVPSSTEYLNGNRDSWASHETCVVADFTWAVGYLFMITGDSKYGDWIENAVFNGGIASVDDDFTSNQYFSCPNQVLADDHSNHAKFYRGLAWMSYAPSEIMACCTGNVNRFMPNFVCRSWMKADNTICAFLYGPSTLTTELGGKMVSIEEQTNYPFENTVKFIFHTTSRGKYTFKARIPQWATKYHVTLNGKTVHVSDDKGFFAIERAFKDGDVIEVSFEDEIIFIPNAGGISVKKGALLYALALNENTVMEAEPRGLGDPDYPHYSLYTDSKWNYGIAPEEAHRATYCPATSIDATPWKSSAKKPVIRVPAWEIDWKLLETDSVLQKLNPRKSAKRVALKATFTPLVPLNGTVATGAATELELVPYCTTRLRIAIFPVVHEHP